MSNDIHAHLSPMTKLFYQITRGSALLSFCAIFLSLLVGSILIAWTDSAVQIAAVQIIDHPLNFINSVWQAVSKAYIALFEGSIYNFSGRSFNHKIKPLLDSLSKATPLIAAGLGIGLTFRAGLFNIGGKGQMLVAASAAAYIGFTFSLPIYLHLPLAITVGMLAGAIYAMIAGLLKSYTGAHEVIVTIMLNYIAYYLISWMLRTPGFLQAPGSNFPKSGPVEATAIFPNILSFHNKFHWGFALVILSTFFCSWLINRSVLGFKLRAVGENITAARVAGINVNRMTIYAMLISGALVGLAGVFQALGESPRGFSSTIDAGIGFSAITVALLGRSKPWGIFAAGLLFGALQAGSFKMQADVKVPIDIILVVQSLIVLFIAAPPLVRTIFRLPDPKKTF
ncbi:ABC transporter permease [Thorsellia anophelis]|uniref:Nucleoside ABC transporter membrane protein n=1 Tax=Thorsellia anophelis DSM 18579 TaxID=1123402 RepID=A0A1H9ZNX5_9GAMM|nr:ABC transporter permease [Thorsellia anophelis]SES83435.1 nucleoside ABC transporter membrane protein [Thorsellia anophelis DSM 18579]